MWQRPRVCRFFLMFAIAGLAQVAWAEEGAERIHFNRQIRPIFSKTCWACHGPDSNHREADLRLDDREAAIDHGDALVPSDAEASEIYQRIISDDEDEQMPPVSFGVQLTAEEKELVRRWIEQGAHYEKHWAFIPPQRPATPEVKQAQLVHNPIDAFVVDRLQAEGLSLSKETDRRTLIRRVTLDLTGLPPTLAEVQDFLADRSPDAYEKVVERLLRSKAYAEHMARRWLDVARYADTNGYQYDRIRNQWVWRDWVIHAFDTNMPFDQFTIEQTAGVCYPTPMIRHVWLLGFIAIIRLRSKGA